MVGADIWEGAVMIVVSYEKELREAFKAGQHSMLPKLANNAGVQWNPKGIPATFEDWMAEKEKCHQPIVRG